MIRGSHIVVPRLHDQPEAYILQNTDNRIVFVIPFEQQFSLIGTTDVEHQASISSVSISEEETDYLLKVANEYFKTKVSHSDIVTTYSGVRPLLDDEADNPQAITRDYTLELDHDDGKPPLLSIFGGKITTYRKLAEAALTKLVPFFPNAGPAWTEESPLPGGNFVNREVFKVSLHQRYPWLPESLACRLVRSYGTLAYDLLGDAGSLDDLGEHIGADLYRREIDYLTKSEWAITSEDILWRRSKLGLFLNDSQKNRLDSILEFPDSKEKVA